MCFSTEASFTAAAILAVGGYATVRQVREKSQMFLALVPWLFAFQQFAEGILWLCLGWDYHPTPLSLTAQYIFLFFALMVYPVWFPIAMLALEKVRKRKDLILITLGFGVFVAVCNAYYVLLTTEITARVVNCSIQYYYPGSLMGRILYLAPIIVSILVSSVRWMWLFGILMLISFIAAEYLYLATFTSVWCFFAAVFSVIIYLIIKKMALYTQST